MVGTPVLNSRPTTRVEDTPIEVDVRSQRVPNRWRARAFGAMFMGGGLAHLVLLSLNSAAYDSFADASYWPYIVTRFRNRHHFAAFNGTAPIDVSSGGKKIYRLSFRGNRHLNHAVHMAAVSQIRYRHSQGAPTTTARSPRASPTRRRCAA